MPEEKSGEKTFKHLNIIGLSIGSQPGSIVQNTLKILILRKILRVCVEMLVCQERFIASFLIRNRRVLG